MPRVVPEWQQGLADSVRQTISEGRKEAVTVLEARHGTLIWQVMLSSLKHGA